MKEYVKPKLEVNEYSVKNILLVSGTDVINMVDAPADFDTEYDEFFY